MNVDKVRQASGPTETLPKANSSAHTLEASAISAQISFAQMMLAQAESSMVSESSASIATEALSQLVKQSEKPTLSLIEQPVLKEAASDLEPESTESSEPATPVASKPIASGTEESKKPAHSSPKSETTPSVLPAVAVWFPSSSFRADNASMNLQSALSPAALSASQAAAETLGGGSRQGQLSEQMQNALAMAHKYGRAVRIDLNSGTQLIFRLSQGRVSAEFLSQSPGLLNSSLSGQLESLKTRLQEQNLPVDTLTIREDTPRGQKQPQQQDADGRQQESSIT
jgi:hypothetical protein